MTDECSVSARNRRDLPFWPGFWLLVGVVVIGCAIFIPVIWLGAFTR